MSLEHVDISKKVLNKVCLCGSGLIKHWKEKALVATIVIVGGHLAGNVDKIFSEDENVKALPLLELTTVLGGTLVAASKPGEEGGFSFDETKKTFSNAFDFKANQQSRE